MKLDSILLIARVLSGNLCNKCRALRRIDSDQMCAVSKQVNKPPETAKDPSRTWPKPDSEPSKMARNICIPGRAVARVPIGETERAMPGDQKGTSAGNATVLAKSVSTQGMIGLKDGMSEASHGPD